MRTRSRSAKRSRPTRRRRRTSQELERRVDELADEADLPSGDSIAAELTRFLRERENDRATTTSPARLASLAERERVRLDAGREPQLEQPGFQRL